MSSSDELAAAVEVATDTFTNNCATAAFVAVLVYDWLLTLRLEVEYIWKQKVSFGKILYLVNRYLVIIDLVILLNSYANPIIHGSKFCLPWFHIDSWLGFISLLSIDTIMLMRTWAMWHRSKTALAILLGLQVLCNLAEGGATLWVSLTVFYIPSPDNIRPCLTGFARPNVMYGMWLGVLVWDLAIMIATLIRAVPSIRFNRTATPMITLILRDGVQYFFFLLLIAIGNIFVINYAPGPLATMLLTLLRVTNSVIGSRIMLNLRGMLLDPSYNTTQGSTTLGGSSALELMPLGTRSGNRHKFTESAVDN